MDRVMKKFSVIRDPAFFEPWFAEIQKKKSVIREYQSPRRVVCSVYFKDRDSWFCIGWIFVSMLFSFRDSWVNQQKNSPLFGDRYPLFTILYGVQSSRCAELIICS